MIASNCIFSLLLMAPRSYNFSSGSPKPLSLEFVEGEVNEVLEPSEPQLEAN